MICLFCDHKISKIITTKRCKCGIEYSSFWAQGYLDHNLKICDSKIASYYFVYYFDNLDNKFKFHHFIKSTKLKFKLIMTLDFLPSINKKDISKTFKRLLELRAFE